MAYSDRRFMVDDSLLDGIVADAKLSEGDVVFEVGAGTGNLTQKLAKHTRVFAIESDSGLYNILKRRLSGNEGITLIQGDALRVEYPFYNKIVSNIPYSISRQLLERIIMEGFELAVIVVQKEFADKLQAKPLSNNYRMISVLAQTTCNIDYLREIPPQVFKPQPKVSSAALRLKQIWRPTREYIIFLNKLFSQKNKKIRNIMDAPKKYQQLRPVEVSPQEMLDFYRSI